MRTARRVGIATVGFAALAGGGIVFGSAISAIAGPPMPGVKTTVIQLRSETKQFALIDVGDKGPALGLGDEIVSSDQLFRHGEPVGRSGTVLTVVGVDKDRLTTQWLTTIDLTEGQLILQGVGDGPTAPPTVPITFTVGVTGGTGAFSRARGVATIIDRPGGTEDITVRLSN
jgi:hypothetical protein